MADPQSLAENFEGLSLQEQQQIIFSSPSKILSQQLLDRLHDDNEQLQQLQSLRIIRKMLSRETNPPIQEVLDKGILPTLASLLKTGTTQNDNTTTPQQQENKDQKTKETIQMEAAWALTNIASGTTQQTEEVVNAQCIPSFVAFLTSRNDELRGQAIWALGNISGTNTPLRDQVIQSKILKSLLHMLTTSAKIDIVRNGVWCLSNLCRGKPPPFFKEEEIFGILGVLGVLLESPDEEVLSDVCWSLSYLTDGGEEEIGRVVELCEGLVKKLVGFLGCGLWVVKTPALRTLGNILTGVKTAQVVLDEPNALVFLKKTLSSDRRGLRKEACWAFSNIAAGSRPQIQLLIDNNIFPLVLEMYANAGREIKREIGFIFSNSTCSGSVEQIRYLVEEVGVLRIFLEFLVGGEEGSVKGCLDGIENILMSGADVVHFEDSNPYVSLLKKEKNFDIIESYLKNQDEDISKKAFDILKYFEENLTVD